MFVGEVHIQTDCPRMASGRNRVQLDVCFELLDKTVYLAPGGVLCCTSVRQMAWLKIDVTICWTSALVNYVCHELQYVDETLN